MKKLWALALVILVTFPIITPVSAEWGDGGEADYNNSSWSTVSDYSTSPVNTTQPVIENSSWTSDWNSTTWATPVPTTTPWTAINTAGEGEFTVDPLSVQNSLFQALMNTAPSEVAPVSNEVSFIERAWDTVTDWFTDSSQPLPGIAAVVNSADYSKHNPYLAPFAIASIFGTGLATGTQSATTLPLPTQLAGAKVTVDDTPAGIFFASPTQINFVIPPVSNFFTTLRTVTVQVEVNGARYTKAITLRHISPAFFTADSSGRGLVAGVVLRQKANGTQVYEPLGQFNSATNKFEMIPITVSNPGERVFLVLFGTGMRATELAGNPLDNFHVYARVNGVSTQLINYSIGAQGTLTGLDQVNLEIPPSLAGSGLVDLISSFKDGDTDIAAEPVQINIR